MREPPPKGSPWDLPISETPFAFVDLEMTGLDAAQDRIVEICVERVVGAEVCARIETLVDPESRAGGASEVHGLERVDTDGHAPFAAIAERVRELLEGAVFVAHAAAWDIAFLERAFARLGTPYVVRHYLDTLTLSRRTFALDSHSLDSLRDHFGLSGVRHRAGPDVSAMRVVFSRCLEILAPKSARDLWETRIGERVARAEILEACELAAKDGAEVSVTYRPSRKPKETFRMVLRSVDRAHTPPIVIGYLLPGRGRRELRSDRILSLDREQVPARS